ncbi:DUF998 domain-containing protein [Actinoplanes sp. NPDC051346]|uniref:DUF998 domain-containing protein n=1 Tax=Actinoplanes sp. NPDC051346 TaxID=3155048 RepID=UPI00342A872C
MTPTPSIAHRSTPTPARRMLSVRAATVSLTSGIAFLTLLVLIHVVRPDVSPSWQTTSEYAIGEHGWLMVTAFLLSAVSYGALAVAVLAEPRKMLPRAGALILTLVAVGTLIGGIFVTDPIDTPQDQLSTTGTLHGLGAGLALMLLPVAALLVNLGLTRDSGFPGAGRLLRYTAALPAVALVLFMTAQAILLGDDGFGPDTPIGWPERALVLSYATWQIAAARVISRRTQP